MPASPVPLPMPATPVRPRDQKRWSLTIAATLVVAVLAFIFSGLPALLFVTEVPINTACDAGKADCGVPLPDGSQAVFSLQPRPLISNQPMRMRLQLEHIRGQSAEVSMTGVEMNMVETRMDLTPTGDGSFGGELMLPMCTTGAMEWQANFLVRTRWQSYRLAYRFHSGVQ